MRRSCGAAVLQAFACSFIYSRVAAAVGTATVEVRPHGVDLLSLREANHHAHAGRSPSVPQRRLVRQEFRHASAAGDHHHSSGAELETSAEKLGAWEARSDASLESAPEGDDSGPAQGPSAMIGPAGRAGTAGEAGKDAPAKGANGTKGPPGPSGAKGEPGQQGPPGIGYGSVYLTQYSLITLLLTNICTLACVFLVLKRKIESKLNEAKSYWTVTFTNINAAAVVEQHDLQGRFQEALQAVFCEESGGWLVPEVVSVELALPGDGTLQASLDITGEATSLKSNARLYDAIAACVNNVAGVETAKLDGQEIEVHDIAF